MWILTSFLFIFSFLFPIWKVPNVNLSILLSPYRISSGIVLGQSWHFFCSRIICLLICVILQVDIIGSLPMPFACRTSRFSPAHSMEETSLWDKVGHQLFWSLMAVLAPFASLREGYASIITQWFFRYRTKCRFCYQTISCGSDCR